jgi:glutathione S-transferase
MARVVSLELGVPVEERVIDVYSAEFLDTMNPLRQIPTLITETGAPIYDSRVICMYLDAMSGRASLISAEHRWEIETRWALALGVPGMVGRAEGEKRPGAISKLEVRIKRALLHLERASGSFCDAGVRMDSIAIAVALEYTDFRYTTEWRHNCPQLNAWLQGFARRSSMIQTRPSDPK